MNCLITFMFCLSFFVCCCSIGCWPFAAVQSLPHDVKSETKRTGQGTSAKSESEPIQEIRDHFNHGLHLYLFLLSCPCLQRNCCLRCLLGLDHEGRGGIHRGKEPRSCHREAVDTPPRKGKTSWALDSPVDVRPDGWRHC